MRTRKHPRKVINALGYLTRDGWPIGECVVRDISAGGAKFVHKIADELPADLILALSKDGHVRRSCEFVWRKDDQVRVRFVQLAGRTSVASRPHQ
jgi:PilZ domain